MPREHLATPQVIDGPLTRRTSRSPAAGHTCKGVDQFGQVIDVLVSPRRHARAARVFFARAARFGLALVEVSTDPAPVYPRVIDELVPAARHVLEQYSNSVEADHGRLKVRLGPTRGLKTISSLRQVTAGHAFVHFLQIC